MRVLGLISGTSMDGIDLALVDTDGRSALELGPTGFEPFAPGERDLCRAAVAEAASYERRERRTGAVARAERMLTDLHVRAVGRFIASHGLDRAGIDMLGFHGQTVLHRPERGVTIQLGDAPALARDCGIDVVADLRATDVAAGGQGAPLVPVFHRALALSANLDLPLAFLNVGGVANVTLLPHRDADPIACDTGPGNALLDDLMLERTGIPMDRDGAAATRGRVDEAILGELLSHPYFRAPAPKSLDRNDFSRAPVETLSTPDAAATLTAFTAASVADFVGRLPQRPNVVIVCGGGARNPTLMRELARRVPCPVRTAGDYGWTGDAIEAQAFAYLAVRSRLGLPITFPTTTGVGAPLTGGVFFPARL